MSGEVQIQESELLKSLSRLEGLLIDGDVEKSQIVTGPGSSQGNLTDMHQEKFTDGWSDGISGDGSEYNGRGKTARKGGAETRQEMREVADSDDDDDEEEDRNRRDDDSDDDDDRGAEKGLPASGEPLRTTKPSSSKKDIEPGAPGMTKGGDVDGIGTNIRRSIEIEEDGELRRGIEVSEFLFYLTKSIKDGMYDLQQRLHHRIGMHHGARGEFAQGLAEAVVGINKSLNISEMNVGDEEVAPERAAKSVTQQQSASADLHKSLQQQMNLRKSVLDQLGDLVQKGDGQVNALDVVRFESTGELRPEVRALFTNVVG